MEHIFFMNLEVGLYMSIYGILTLRVLIVEEQDFYVVFMKVWSLFFFPK